MTQLELLAAKVRGADSLEDAATIIADWYDGKVKYSHNNSRESAKILRDGAAQIESPYSDLMEKAASNFDTSASLLEFDRNE